MKLEIQNAFQKYLEAIYQHDFETAYLLLYEPDVINYKNVLTDFAEKIDLFGETEDFLKMLNIVSVNELRQLSSQEFISRLFKSINVKEIDNSSLSKIVKQLRIVKIIQEGYYATIHYQYPTSFGKHKSMINSELKLINIQNQWLILFQSGFHNTLQKYQKQIELYYERKGRDKLENLQDATSLTTYILVGYKNDNDEIVLEARFKDAGDFSDGLAYVKLMRKYGYINTKGEIVIKPSYLSAKDFSEGLAAVKVNMNEKDLWGFIDKQGKMVIQPEYIDVSSFVNGLCAVQKIDDYWGYINTKGEVAIPFDYEEAGDFDFEYTLVKKRNKKGNLIEMKIDKTGKTPKTRKNI